MSSIENFLGFRSDGSTTNPDPQLTPLGGPGNLFNYSVLQETRCEQANEKDNVFGAITVALIVIGLVGNSLVFFTIMVLREYKKSVTNWYILQLTLADTLFLLMLPFTAHSEFRGKWEFSESLCKFKEAVIFINYYASIYFLVVMSFDRYLAVTKAFASNYWVTNLRSPTTSYIVSIVGWILSALLCIQLYNYSNIDNCAICKYEFPKNEIQGLPLNYESSGYPDLSFFLERNETNETGTPETPIEETEIDIEEYLENFFGGGGSGNTDFFEFGNLDNFTTVKPANSYETVSETNSNSTEDYYSFDSIEDIRRFFLSQYNVYIEEDDVNAFIQYRQSVAEESHPCKLPNSKELHIWLYGNFAGAFVLPFVLICFFYGMIMKTITAASSIGDNEKNRSYRRRVTIIVFALVSLFGISWLPWYVDKLAKINGINLSSEQCETLSDAVRGIAYLNSAFNPYFYSFLGFHFRDRLKRASGQVRLLSSLRSRATLISSVRRKRQSSSNSVGSIRAPMASAPPSTNGQIYGLRQETARGSLTQKTERTVV